MLRKWTCEVVSLEEEGTSWGRLSCMASNALDATTKLTAMLRSQSIPDAKVAGVRRARNKGDSCEVVVKFPKKQKVA